AAFGDVKLGQPGTDAVGVELLIPGAVKRVGEIDSLAVAADLDQLRPARQRLARPRRMRRPADDAADPHRAGLARVEWVADVVLLQLTGPPARHVQVLVVD